APAGTRRVGNVPHAAFMVTGGGEGSSPRQPHEAGEGTRHPLRAPDPFGAREAVCKTISLFHRLINQRLDRLLQLGPAGLVLVEGTDARLLLRRDPEVRAGGPAPVVFVHGTANLWVILADADAEAEAETVANVGLAVIFGLHRLVGQLVLRHLGDGF